MMVLIVYVVLLAPYMYVFFLFFICVWITEWPPIGKMDAHSDYNMFS